MTVKCKTGLEFNVTHLRDFQEPQTHRMHRDENDNLIE